MFTAAEGTFDGDGVVTVEIQSNGRIHQIAVQTDGTAGTLAVEAVARGRTDSETVYESDGTTPLSIDLADYKSAKLENYSLKALRFTVADFDGTAGLITVTSGD
jgi:hypothetical protein